MAMARQPQRIHVVHRWADSGRELTVEELEERRQALAWAFIQAWAQVNGYTVSFEQQDVVVE